MATMMQQVNTLRRAMEEGKGSSMGVWQTLPGSNLSRVIARCGVDWIVVDCEHGNIDGKFIIYK
jgi:4-hydroxy-2-oxoheptanedioate aldolase